MTDVLSEHLRGFWVETEGSDCVEMNRHLNNVLLLSAAEALRMQKTYLKTRFHLCKCLGFGLKWAWVCSDAFKIVFFPSLFSALVFSLWCSSTVFLYWVKCSGKHAIEKVCVLFMAVLNAVIVYPEFSLRNHNSVYLSICAEKPNFGSRFEVLTYKQQLFVILSITVCRQIMFTFSWGALLFLPNKCISLIVSDGMHCVP